MDGAQIGSQPSSQAPPGFGIARAYFGDNNGLGESESRWSLVSFEVGQHIVPEPASLLLIGLAGLLLRRRTAVR